MSIATLFPTAFPALALAHFVALLSPGPDFFLLTAYALRYRLRGSIGICCGIALGNGFYILLAIVGGTVLQHVPLLFTLLQVAGAFYLLWIGSLLIRSATRTTALTATAEHRTPTMKRQLMLSLGSAILNPKNILFYISLMTSILGPSVSLLQHVVSGSWMFSVVLLWDVAVAAAISLQPVQHALQRYLYVIERSAGVVLILFGVFLLVGR